MNNKLSNPLLKQLISEISSNANKGRLNLSWSIIEEAKKKKKVKEADEPKKDDPAAKADGDLPPLGGADEKPKTAGQEKSAAGADKAPFKADASPKIDAAPKADAGTDSGSDTEEADKAKEDAAKAKAELAKAEAEKNKAEEKIKDQSYISLGSSSGTQFLLGKVLDQAFKTNTIDTLAGEMVNTLGINTPEDLGNFSDDVVTYMNIPGMPELLSSMKPLANKEPAKSKTTPAA